MKDLSSTYAITLFRTTTVLTVLYCGMHRQYSKVCMYMIRRALSLYLWGKESFIHKYMSTQEYMSLSETYLTTQAQIGLCPYKVDILL